MKTIQTTEKHTQRAFILARLRERPYSTNELRDLGIYSPPARVIELREKGYEIATSYRDECDNANIKHRVGVYTLISEPDENQGQGGE